MTNPDFIPSAVHLSLHVLIAESERQEQQQAKFTELLRDVAQKELELEHDYLALKDPKRMRTPPIPKTHPAFEVAKGGLLQGKADLAQAIVKFTMAYHALNEVGRGATAVRLQLFVDALENAQKELVEIKI